MPTLGDDYLTDLPLPDVCTWPIFPFEATSEGELAIRTVRPFNDAERIRDGDPGGPRCGCESDDPKRQPVWSNGKWKVGSIDFGKGGAPIPAYMLGTVEHMDFDDFDETLAAELGVMTLRLERAIMAIGNIGRVHFNRWGDGGAHFHVWFLGRPFGASQFSGFTLPFWAFALPPLEADIVAKNDQIIRDHLDAAEQ